jgi:hypothetical protein
MAVLTITAAPLAFGASALFPRALHLVRRVDDPISKTSATIDEYCAGNRVVTVRGAKVTVADYDTQQLTEIDHAAQTWSVTPFAEIAQSRVALDARMGATSAAPATRLTARSGQASGQTSSVVETFVDERSNRRLEIGIDRRVTLSRAAAEVLIGAAYPGKGSDEQEQILAAAGGGGSVSAMSAGAAVAGTYGLVTERTLTIDVDGTKLVTHNSIVRVGDEMPPADATLVDPGARRIESRLTRLARELREIDTLPAANAQH